MTYNIGEEIHTQAGTVIIINEQVAAITLAIRHLESTYVFFRGIGCSCSRSRTFYAEESGCAASQQPLSVVCSINFRKSNLRNKHCKDLLTPVGLAYVG